MDTEPCTDSMNRDRNFRKMRIKNNASTKWKYGCNIIIHCTLSLSLSLSLHAAIWMYGKFKNAVLSHNKKASLYSRSHFTLCTFAAHCFRYPTSYITTDDRVNSNIGPFRDHSCSFRILTPRIICWYTKIMFFQEQSYRYLWFPKFVVIELKSLTSWKWTLS